MIRNKAAKTRTSDVPSFVESLESTGADTLDELASIGNGVELEVSMLGSCELETAATQVAQDSVLQIDSVTVTAVET